MALNSKTQEQACMFDVDSIGVHSLFIKRLFFKKKLKDQSLIFILFSPVPNNPEIIKTATNLVMIRKGNYRCTDTKNH